MAGRAMRLSASSVVRGLAALAFIQAFPVSATGEWSPRQEQTVPVLAVTSGEEADGALLYIVVALERRSDESGMQVRFLDRPGRFSTMARWSIEQAIRQAAQSLALNADSWTVTLTVPYPSVTVYGDSLSAAVGLSVAAMAQGRHIRRDMAITGTITPQGRIGTVGGISPKVAAAGRARLRAVLVPGHGETADVNRAGTFPTQVVPIESVSQAYDTLTTPGAAHVQLDNQ